MAKDIRQPESETDVSAPPALVYVSGDMPGITRHRRGRGFAYRRANGHWLKASDPADRADLDRIRRLAVPPAYTDVWICPLPDGHLQATGRDARGRKQYRYHAQWMNERGDEKFNRLLSFGRALPRLREAVERHLSPSGASPSERERMLATLVRLLDSTCVRVGNESYARSNGSYGLTTLRTRHVAVRGAHVRLHFKGKSGVEHQLHIEDRHVARMVRRCQALPGQELFQYEDEQGEIRGVDSHEVNAYIREATGGDFSAKDFRTWHASVQAWSLIGPRGALGVEGRDRWHQERWSARRLREALTEVAGRLGNTVAVCRKSYVHPALLACATQGRWPELRRRPQRSPLLSDPERGLMAFLSAWAGGAGRGEGACALLASSRQPHRAVTRHSPSLQDGALS